MSFVKSTCALGTVCALVLMAHTTGATETAPTRNPVQTVHQNPELAAHSSEGDDVVERSKALAISNLDIGVEIAGDTAHTTVTASFANSGPSALEGNFAFDLPAGSVVTGYALDVHDKMVDGVLVARQRAQTVYTKTVRRGVDPGLAEVTRDNAFTTRIFPIMPGRGRTIRFEFVTPVDPGKAFALPLFTVLPVGTATIHVAVSGVADAPTITGPQDLKLGWTRTGARYEAKASLANRPLSGELSVFAVDPAQKLMLARHSGGEAFFEIDDMAGKETRSNAHPERLRVYWDTSRSRRDQNLDDEKALLGAYVDQVHPKSLDLVFFADIEPVVKTLTSPSSADVAAALKDAEYRGATSLTPLFKPNLAPADVCVLFSDGNINLDSWHVQRMPCTMFTVSGAADANRGFLRAMAARSAGEFVDLTTQKTWSALARLTREAPRVLDVTDDKGRSLDYTLLAANAMHFRVVGKLPDEGGITVKLARAPAQTYAVDRSKIEENDDLAVLWAAARIDEELGASDRPDMDKLVAMSRRYSVAGAAADFLVLENVRDYVANRIEPPASLGKEMLADYRADIEDERRSNKEDETAHLDELARRWGEYKTWWKTDFKPVKQPKKAANGAIEYEGTTNTDTLLNNLPAPPPPPPPAPANARPSDSASTETTVVTSARAASRRASGGNSGVEAVVVSSPPTVPEAPQIEVQIADWNPDRPYLKALAAASQATFWSVYRDQERQYGNSMGFYFDVAEYLFRHKRQADAIKIVLNTLDLPGADTATLTILADRLMRYGDETRALWLYDQIVLFDSDRPQPLRNLALALVTRAEDTAKRGGAKAAQRADYQRALTLLTQVATRNWDDAYTGVDLIALMEVNHVIPRLKKLGGDVTLDPRFVALLDVDLRVVLEWNTDGTDMDLWVDEPTGERAIYSHNRTAIGGRLSHDMTQGYGPEEYLLHKGPDGTYTVRVNVYATDRLNPNGATTVRAHVFRNYDRANEQEQVLELELKRSEKKDDAHLVGTVTVKHGR